MDCNNINHHLTQQWDKSLVLYPLSVVLIGGLLARKLLNMQWSLTLTSSSTAAFSLGNRILDLQVGVVNQTIADHLNNDVKISESAGQQAVVTGAMALIAGALTYAVAKEWKAALLALISGGLAGRCFVLRSEREARGAKAFERMKQKVRGIEQELRDKRCAINNLHGREASPANELNTELLTTTIPALKEPLEEHLQRLRQVSSQKTFLKQSKAYAEALSAYTATPQSLLDKLDQSISLLEKIVTKSSELRARHERIDTVISNYTGSPNWSAFREAQAQLARIATLQAALLELVQGPQDQWETGIDRVDVGIGALRELDLTVFGTDRQSEASEQLWSSFKTLWKQATAAKVLASELLEKEELQGTDARTQLIAAQAECDEIFFKGEAAQIDTPLSISSAQTSTDNLRNSVQRLEEAVAAAQQLLTVEPNEGNERQAKLTGFLNQLTTLLEKAKLLDKRLNNTNMSLAHQIRKAERLVEELRKDGDALTESEFAKLEDKVATTLKFFPLHIRVAGGQTAN